MTCMEPNLLITKGFIRQIANISGIKCTLKPFLKVSEILGSKGIAVIEAKYNSSDLRTGTSWYLDIINTQKKGILVPNQVEYCEHQGGRVSFRMTNYKSKPSTSVVQEKDELEH